MSSTRNILKFLQLGGGKRRNFSRNLASSMLLNSRAIGTAGFFLSGNIIVKRPKGSRKNIYLSQRDKYKRTASGKLSIAEAVNESFTGYPEIDSVEDVHPLHQTLRFKRSVMRLKEKANEVCEIYPTMPKPGVRSKIDEDKLIIQIPLLSTHDDILKGIFVQEGSLDITYEEGVHLSQCKVVLEKQEPLTDDDIESLLEAYKRSYINSLRPARLTSTENIGKMFSKNINVESLIEKTSAFSLVETLQEKGCSVYIPAEGSKLSWDNLAGYDKVKRTIEDSVLFTLTHPDVFKEIVSNTRVAFETNKPKCILFEGPPGCGKTTTARIMGQEVNLPLIYLPVEAILSKFYGESESKLSEIFEHCQKFRDCILFIDEIDSLATSRDDNIHEATRRMLSTLLRKIDSFESQGNVLLICATNRKDDLDSALISRIDLSIKFELPDSGTRSQIFQKYAKQLSETELSALAESTEGMSGRDLFDVCKDSERRWGAKYIRKEVEGLIPQSSVYEECIADRQKQINI